uniref:Uncharacterized protein n=1 Tax=viral metagenome TaxID=1070528 RepID=A0A6C0BIY4_9ZZZZ
MSATRTRASNRRGDQYFVNIVALAVATSGNANDVYDSTGASLMTTTSLTALQLGFTGASPAAGTVMVRDMGTQVTVPGDYQGASGNTARRVLRKVQLIASDASSLNTAANNNINEGVKGTATGSTVTAQGNVANPGYGCFYIEVGGIAPSNNAVGGVNKWASLSLPQL